jgi:uncharacterized protein (DUF1330 family)
MAAYWMVRSSAVRDEAALKEYQRLLTPLAARYGFKRIAGGDHQTPEGPEFPRVLLLEFPDYEQAVACYYDPDYTAAMEHASKAFDRELIIIDGA